MLHTITTPPLEDYALVDSGDGEKLERYGPYILRRPDPQALWKKHLSAQRWNAADATFVRDGKKTEWILKKGMQEKWSIHIGGLHMWIRPTAFKHTGMFPEQLPNWQWMQELIQKRKRPVKVLNLFGYTGGASLAAAAAGAEVVHVDGSKVAIGWGKDNALLSRLDQKPIRWILDDVRVFVKREIKRGNTYDGIILDPPAFGHGAKKEVWVIEKDLLPLLDMCAQILSETPLFFLLNGYASGYSSIAYENNLHSIGVLKNGVFEKGEVTIQEEQSGRLLPAGIFARWSARDT